MRRIVLGSSVMQEFREMLFMRVVPNVKNVGLLGPRVRIDPVDEFSQRTS